MAVRLLDLDEHALEMARVVVGLVERELYVLAVQFVLVDDADLAIDADGVVDAGDEEDEADVGAALNVLIGLEKAVAGHIREQQTVIVDHLDEPRLAALGGGVAAAIGVGGGHYNEGSVLHELLHPRSQVSLELLDCSLRRRAKLPVESAVAD